MIISLFGPDGVGKTTLAHQLSEQIDVPVLNGTNSYSWPDTSWHDEFAARGINEKIIDDDDHFYEKIRRAHGQAALLDGLHGNVVLDSDPAHKVFIHSVLRGKGAPDLAAQLDALTGHDYDRPRLHLDVRVSREGTRQEHGLILQRRLHLRGNLSPFDPQTPEASVAMIEASEELKDQLRAMGRPAFTIYSDEPLPVDAIVAYSASELL